MSTVSLDNELNKQSCKNSGKTYVEIDADTYSNYNFLAMKVYEQAFTIIGLIGIAVIIPSTFLCNPETMSIYMICYVINMILGVMGMLGFVLCFMELANYYNIIDKLVIYNKPVPRGLPQVVLVSTCTISYKYDNSNDKTQVIMLDPDAAAFLQFIVIILLLILGLCIILYSYKMVGRVKGP